MVGIVCFCAGAIFGAGLFLGIAALFFHTSNSKTLNKKDKEPSVPALDPKQKEFERQYMNLLNYDGRKQRSVNDED